MRFPAFLLLLLLLVPSLAHAGRLAVLELHGSADDDALVMLTNALRAGAADATRGRSVTVLTRENMAVLLTEMGEELGSCEGACEVETARNVGADHVVSGQVLRVDGAWVVDLKFHETKGGDLVDTAGVVGNSMLELRSLLTPTFHS